MFVIDFATYRGDTNPHRRSCIQRVEECACAGVTTLRLRIIIKNLATVGFDDPQRWGEFGYPRPASRLR
jgi:hypothetical protein